QVATLARRQRQANPLAVQMLVALVGGIYRDGGIAQHSFGTGGGDGNEFFASDHRIADLVELARGLLMNDFEIGDSGGATRAPVDDVSAAVDEPLFVEADEDFFDGG